MTTVAELREAIATGKVPKSLRKRKLSVRQKAIRKYGDYATAMDIEYRKRMHKLS